MEKNAIEAIIEKNRVKIEEAVEAQITQDITSSLTWSLKDSVSVVVKEFVEAEVRPAVVKRLKIDRDSVSVVVKEFVEAEVRPAVVKRLKIDRDSIIEAVCKSIPTIAEGLSVVIAAKIAKVLTDDYKVGRLMKDLF